ncbi:serine hydrolase domain-containing protein [Legionella tucsonensis]|uniref:Putative secreted esterase n=1 Tax=Legionella tucsonensis TaxID=40335 RepID=A0A0W0ZTU5_9GAMM|nr:serine hydrolase [Legionella tucsonensis]KTD72575.1 putative secreted esterase [Legionella tucsonensis]
MKAKVVKLAASLIEDLSSLAFRSNSTESEVERIIKKANIEKVSVSTVTGSGSPVTHNYGDVDKDTVFGAASLSKPVFTYLVLKLAEAGELSLDMRRLNDILPFKDFCQQHGFTWKNNEKDRERINAFTPAMILAHKTGFDLNRKGEVNHQFEPGQEYYRYSGLPLFYLQKVIEKMTNSTLEELAKEYIFKPLHMNHSSFYPKYELQLISDKTTYEPGKIYLKATKKDLEYAVLGGDSIMPWHGMIPWHKLPRDFPRNTSELIQLKEKWMLTVLTHLSNIREIIPSPCAANSLTTTAEDYALFVQAWMNDETLHYAFNPQILMTQDPWAKETVSDHRDLKYVAECLGFQLEVDENGKPLTAFKTGDMGPWRGWVAIDLTGDLQKRKATVFFAKGPDEGNGHILAETLIKPYFQLEHAMRWFKEKYGFATGWEENWEALQKVRCIRGMSYQEQSPKVSQSIEEVTAFSDSTQKMFHLTPPKQEPAPKTIQSQKQEAHSNQPVQEVEQSRDEDKVQEERKFNPTPFSPSYY